MWRCPAPSRARRCRPRSVMGHCCVRCGNPGHVPSQRRIVVAGTSVPFSHGPGVWREPHSRRVQREALGECRGGGNSADAAEQAAVASFNLLSEAFVVILQSGNRSCRTLHTPPGAKCRANLGYNKALSTLKETSGNSPNGNF